MVFPTSTPRDGGERAGGDRPLPAVWDIRGVSAEPTFQPRSHWFDDPGYYPMYERSFSGRIRSLVCELQRQASAQPGTWTRCAS